MARTTNRYEGLAALAAEGKTCVDLAEHFGVCRATIKRVADQRGISIARKVRDPFAAPSSRDAKILSMYRSGIVMEKIGSQFGITRERVRQILAKQGVFGQVAVALKSKKRAEAKRAIKNAKCIAQHGVELDVYKAAAKAGHVHAYRQQKHSANSRGVSWGLTFGEWLDIWKASGKLELRGRGVGKFCMSRVCDAGGYQVGNVHIQLSTENNSEFITKNAGKRNANTGVYFMYPGLSRPWMVKAGKSLVGFFATEEEATTARIEWLSKNPFKRRNGKGNRLGAGRGFQLFRGKFKVVVAKKYYGVFSTEEEAIAKRQAVLATLLQAA